MPDNPSETSYFARFVVFFIDVATETVLKVFYSHVGGNRVQANTYLSSNRGILEKVFPGQLKRVCSVSANTDTFDLSTLTTILTCGNLKILQPPSHGWKANPPGSDISTAADLLRLRNIRNKIVAHRHEAKFTKEEFENNFQEVEDILKRITMTNAPNSLPDLARKTDTYKNMEVIPIDKKKYFMQIEKWHDDFQKQVEKVLDGLAGLKIFFEKSDVKHKRYIQFLSEGGRLVLSVYLKTALVQGGETIEQMLIRNRATLQTELVPPEMIHQLYPSNESDDTSANTDVNTWSLLLLGKVILIVFHSSLKRNEKKNIESIAKQVLNTAQTIKLTLNKDRFTHCCANLRHNILSLAESLDQDTESQVEILLNRFESETEDADDIDDHLKTLGCQEFRHYIDMYRASIKEYKEALEQMEDADMYFKTTHELKIKIELFCEDAEMTKLATRELTTWLQKVVSSSGKQLKNEQYVPVSVLYELISHLEKMPTVKVSEVKESCVMLSITCQSKQGILQLVEFVESPMFQNHLIAISNCFESRYQEMFVLTGYWTLDSLHKAHPDQMQSEQKRSIELSLSYTSPEETGRIESVVSPLYQRQMLTGRTEQDYSSYMTRSTVENLREDNAKLTSRIHVLESVGRDVEEKLKQMEIERIRDSEMIEMLNAETRQHKVRIHDLEREKEESHIQSMYLIQENDGLRGVLSEKEQVLIKEGDRLENLTEKNRRYQERLDELDTAIEDQRRRELPLQKENKRLQEALIQITQDVKLLDKQYLVSEADREYIEHQAMRDKKELLKKLAEVKIEIKNVSKARRQPGLWKYEERKTEDRRVCKELLEKSGNELIRLDRALGNSRQENSRLTMELYDSKMKLTETHHQDAARSSEVFLNEHRFLQEIEYLKDKLSAEKRLHQEYIRRNTRIYSEINEIRDALHIVDQQQTNNRQLLERNTFTYTPDVLSLQPFESNVPFGTFTKSVWKSYEISPYLLPRKRLCGI